MANKLLTIEEFIRRAKFHYGEKYTYDHSVYRGYDEKITVTCVVHGNFEIITGNFLRGNTGCKLCGKFVDKTKFIMLSRKKHGTKYIYDKVQYTNTYTKVEIVCPKHGSFYQTPYLHYHRGDGCVRCSHDKNKYKIDDFVLKARKIHGNRYDYSAVDFDESTEYINIRCPEHGWYKQRPGSHLYGNKCTDCARNDSKLGKEEFVKKARIIHGDRYIYDKVIYVNNKTKVKITCVKHGDFLTKPNCHLSNKAGCPKCRESGGESAIRVFLEKNKIHYIKEYIVPPYKYRYDYYLPDLNLLIEYHGLQHYRPVKRFGGEEAFKSVVVRDEHKKQIAKEKGFNYLVLNICHKKGDDLTYVLAEYLLAFKRIHAMGNYMGMVTIDRKVN